LSERDLRRARLAHLLAFAFIPVGATASVRAFGDDLAFPAVAVAVIPYFVSGYRLTTAKCPKCNDHFFWSFTRGANPVANRCLHCRHQI
jgi:hypothetical protein